MLSSTYKIVRFFAQGDGPDEDEDLPKGLTLEEAQAHCRDPETNSRTATTMDAYTEQYGPWFDGYTEE